ncbi:hypothetical protein Q8W71_02210 [Methylobacterium sp. NEAU 140]|uniref:hypothetical protein n=1 Tax=Methylobacterium sp. NEAU 140 TaxID=3064945 RepID=UPI002734F66F|nr:hypothetical protein [Methylobacterium sp. NEAU 140]MDP4021422.1 hypothetical protein [Methylobacterium sp. NEAU 140]
MSVRIPLLAGSLLLALAGTASAQTTPPGTPGPGGTVATPQTNSTGAPAAGTVAPGGNPAASISNDSSSAGNAGQPSRAAPQGGGGGSR